MKESIQEERIYLGSYKVWRKKSSGTLAVERQPLHVMDGQRRISMVETLTVDSSALINPEGHTPRIRNQLEDHLGTAALETDEAGAVINYEEYHPYGSTAWYADDGPLDWSTNCGQRHVRLVRGVARRQHLCLGWRRGGSWVRWRGCSTRPQIAAPVDVIDVPLGGAIREGDRRSRKGNGRYYNRYQIANTVHEWTLE